MTTFGRTHAAYPEGGAAERIENSDGRFSTRRRSHVTAQSCIHIYIYKYITILFGVNQKKTNKNVQKLLYTYGGDSVEPDGPGTRFDGGGGGKKTKKRTDGGGRG